MSRKTCSILLAQNLRTWERCANNAFQLLLQTKKRPSGQVHFEYYIVSIDDHLYSIMKAVKIIGEGKEFLEANKNAFVVLVFNAEFTEQNDVVKKAVKALQNSSELKDRIALGTVDVEENNELATSLSVISVPMIVCMRNGNVIKKVDSLEPAQLVRIIKEELDKLELFSTGDEAPLNDSTDRNREYIKKLTTRAPVMIFMKGEPKAPRCGFSRQLVEILSKHDITYETFDILQDEQVRQGLKEYSEWPTYPQIYVKGEFVGGLDILKQLEEQGELESTLKV